MEKPVQINSAALQWVNRLIDVLEKSIRNIEKIRNKDTNNDCKNQSSQDTVNSQK